MGKNALDAKFATCFVQLLIGCRLAKRTLSGDPETNSQKTIDLLNQVITETDQMILKALTS